MSSPAELIKIVDTVFDPDGDKKQIFYLRPRGQATILYKVWLYLDGPSMPFINKVTYILHPTFPNPERAVEKTVSNPDCEMVIWAWGTFTVQAVVEDKQGKLTRLERYLTFDKQIEKAKKSGVQFTEIPG
ncbi:MAG: pYEATS domain-containing protein [Chloroflexota bacterium]